MAEKSEIESDMHVDLEPFYQPASESELLIFNPYMPSPPKEELEGVTDDDFVSEPPASGDDFVSEPPVSEDDFVSMKHVFGVDLTDTFTTQAVFCSLDELISWTRDVGKTVGSVVVIKKSDTGNSHRTPRISFACERGGKYRLGRKNYVFKGTKKKSGSKRCGCPFALSGIKMPIDDQWMIKVDSGIHNHPLAQPFEGHSFVGKLTGEEKKVLVQMSISGVKPQDILHILKTRDARNASTLTTIYNARAKLKRVEMAARSQMQQLLKKLAEQEYVEYHRKYNDTEKVKDLFWAHPDSIRLAKCFPDILLIDCTYTNRFNMPLLEIVGITSTDIAFSIAFAYLEAEREENFVWALECLKSVLEPEAQPLIVVTAREVALMEAIGRVFPEAHNILCRWHISKNLLTNCKTFFETSEEFDKFISRWNNLVLSSTEEEYFAYLSIFQRDYANCPDALSYVNDNCLSDYKERFVAAWTDRLIHFGNTTTNRVESAQVRLKKELETSQGDFASSWELVNGLLILQHTTIKSSFERSLTTVMDDFKAAIFKEVRGFVAISALNIIQSQLKQLNNIGASKPPCDCVTRRTHGLPCACEIAQYKLENRPIPLLCIHPHWKKLSDISIVQTNERPELDPRPVIELFYRKFNEVDDMGKLELLKQLKEVLNSSPMSKAKRSKLEK